MNQTIVTQVLDLRTHYHYNEENYAFVLVLATTVLLNKHKASNCSVVVRKTSLLAYCFGLWARQSQVCCVKKPTRLGSLKCCVKKDQPTSILWAYGLNCGQNRMIVDRLYKYIMSLLFIFTATLNI